MIPEKTLEIIREEAEAQFPTVKMRVPDYNELAKDKERKAYIAGAKRGYEIGYEAGYSQGHEDQMKMRIADAMEKTPPKPQTK